MNKNTLCLWYNTDAEEAARFYARTFPDSAVGAVHRAPADFPGGKAGDVLTVEFTVCGMPCIGLNGGDIFKHSEAFSFQIATEDQAETDRYWNAIVGNGGKESQCGWCKDKWGLSWQITPRVLTDAMAKGGDVFLLDMGEPVLITDLAARMARLNGLKPIILNDPQQRVAPGEIGIVFTRLRPGEKLYEELLIGNDPHPTNHPRIMAAKEIRQPLDRVLAALDLLAIACDANDIDRIRKVFVDMHTAYHPSDAIVDQFWPLAVEPMLKPEAPRRLALVNG